MYFLDIDDTLIKTTSLADAHLFALKTSFKKLRINKSDEIVADFATNYSLLYASHQGKTLSTGEKKTLNIFVERLSRLEKNIIDKYEEIKIWSREAALYISAEKYDIKLSNNDLIFII